jgi:hypothetical protein
MAALGLTTHISTCRRFPPDVVARQGRQRFGLPKVDAGSFGDTPTIIFVAIRLQTIAPRQKTADQCRGNIKTPVLETNLRTASYDHLSNTPVVNQ